MLRHKLQPSSESTPVRPVKRHTVQLGIIGHNDGQTVKHKSLDYSSSGGPVEKGQTCENYFFHVFGFQKQDLISWDRLIRLLCRPSDPASLGTLRFAFGFLMVLDIFQERGLSAADSWWGSDTECRFPLFNFLRPLPLQWMYVVYLIMLTGAIGIMLGLKMRLSAALYLTTYWYILFLNKSAWNNHSYLFGILAFLLAISDANRYWSVDGLLDPAINNAHIPLWNYTLIRAQIFIVYFIAGVKKLDMDWVFGYSMQSLSHHWIFYPFKIFLTECQIDMYIVHLGGLFIDLSSGFLLIFDQTRFFGLIISSSFHFMNSQIFPIGMFPYAMLVTQLVFCNMRWPRKFFLAIPSAMRLFTPDNTDDFQSSSNCIYPKDYIKPETLLESLHTNYTKQAPPSSPTWKHKLASLFSLMFICWQLFLPYSHGITKGYNNWTNGLYGYSWDMMIHSWSVQHIHITYYDKDTGQSGYLHPMVWTGGNRRWSSHGDMIKQYAHCIADNLKSYNISNVAVYFDIWRSLNYRFQQRTVDPRVDIITAEWHPFKQPSWLMPLMVDLSDWRAHLDQIQASLDNETSTHVVFVADFPGMYLKNFVHEDFGNTTISVLAGEVIVELDNKTNVTLSSNQLVQVSSNSSHLVHTVSEKPSCYMYTFFNTTQASFMKGYTQFEEDYNKSQSVNETIQRYQQDPNLTQYQKILESKLAPDGELMQTVWQKLQSFFRRKYNLFRRSIRLSTGAVYCLATGSSFSDFLNATYQWEATATVKT